MEQLNLVYQLKVLVVVFDTPTRLLLIVTCLVTSIISPAFYISYSAILFTFLIISDIYKGDNIENLIVDPPRVPFDTFTSLVENQFKVFVRRIKLEDRVNVVVNNSLGSLNNYLERHRHVGNGVISEFLHNVLKPWPPHEWEYYLKNLVTKKTWMLLNSTKMFSARKDSLNSESVHDILGIEMVKCKKSAVVVDEEMAIQLYNILKENQKPVYFGKDIIHEIFYGYRYYGNYPTNVLLRSRYYFETGIIEWWQKYFRWTVMHKPRTDDMVFSSVMKMRAAEEYIRCF